MRYLCVLALEIVSLSAGVRRRFGNSLAADLDALNLFDTFYMQGASSVPGAVRGRYGAPLTIEATFDVRF